MKQGTFPESGLSYKNYEAKKSSVPLPPCMHQGGEDSPYSFLTSPLDGGEWSPLRPGRVLPLGKGPPVPIGYEAEWTSEPVWIQRLEEKSFATNEDRAPFVQYVVRHYTD
jgi:hypothetical protein